MSPIRKTLHRYEIPNHVRFLTFSCDHRLPYFDDEEVKDIFAQQLFLTRARLGFKLHAWVIMPEHVHLLITPNLPAGGPMEPPAPSGRITIHTQPRVPCR